MKSIKNSCPHTGLLIFFTGFFMQEEEFLVVSSAAKGIVNEPLTLFFTI